MKAIAVTLTIEAPVKAADTAETVSFTMETVFNNFFQCYVKTVLTVSQVKLKGVY